MSSQWTEFVSKLSGDHSGVLKISHVKNDHQLLLAGIDSIMSGVIEKTERFLKENTIYMLSCHFFPSRHFFVANYWWARVVSISNNLRAYKVEVSLAESGHKFYVRGTQPGLDTMVNNLKQLGSGVKCHIARLVNQSQVKFLLSSKCKKKLEKLGRSTQCVFSLKEEPVDLVVSLESSQRATSEVDTKSAASGSQTALKRSSVPATVAGGSAGVSQTTVSSSSVAEVTKLFVYGESDESIRTALRRFEDLVKDKFTRKKIEDKCIQNMTEDEARSRCTFTIPTADLHSLEKSDLNPAKNLIKTENDGQKCSVPLENQIASFIKGIKVISSVPAGSREGGVPTVLENKNPMVKRDVPKSKEKQQSPLLEKNVSKLRESKENTLIEREIDSLEYEALKYLLEDSFTCCATKTSGKGGRVTVSVPMTGDICDKIDSLWQETVSLDESDLSKLENPINTRSEGVEAFVKVFQKERKVVIFSFGYSNMNKAKHLLQVKTGKITRRSRVARKFGEGSSSSSSQQPSTHTHSKPVDRIELNTESGIKVFAYKTDITKLPVDAIVNAANNNLQHGSGVAAAIAKAAGPSLEEEGDDYINKYGPLKVSQVIPTTSGALPCRAVLHAVGPRWWDYEDKMQCQQDLEQTVFNCLETAHNMKFGSLAVSSIGSAIFGVPKDVCAEMYLQAVQRFDSHYGITSCLRQIHFIDISDEMVSKIQDVFSQKWKSARYNVQSKQHSRTQAATSGNRGQPNKNEYP
ncbi:uncharacterized protein LOC112564212 [Pomacea canaliculata]|uniref:uncharacterized protein LOC112564212 n=1 Tax=Pomacea canaliculata TaxID=400727 RepID=UPI000D73B8A8|nr:uncharacterized protein LOC112564212 [Pomacea canaliculata]